MNLKRALLCLVVSLAAGCGGSSEKTDSTTPATTAITSTAFSNSYLPAQGGAVWRYDVADSSESITLSSSNVIKNNGQESVELTWDHSGYKQTLRQKNNAVYIDRIKLNQVTVDNKDYQVEVDLSENPALLLPEYAVIGDMKGSDGYHDMKVKISPNVGPAYGEYTYEWSYKGTETVKTTTGSYEALHIRYRLILSISVTTQDYGTINTTVDINQGLWLVPGIGIVKLADYSVTSSSAASSTPFIAVLSGFNKYKNENNVIAPLPEKITIASDSPWKNIHSFYKLNELYGNWENEYQCDSNTEYSPSFKLSLNETSYTLRTLVTNNESCNQAKAHEYIESGTYKLLGHDIIDTDYLRLELMPSSSEQNYYRFGNLVHNTHNFAYTHEINLASGKNGSLKLAVDTIPEKFINQRFYTNLKSAKAKAPNIEGLEKTALVYFRMYDDAMMIAPEEDFAGWGMQVWNDKHCDSILASQLKDISWEKPLQPLGYDPSYGIYFELKIKEGNTGCANVIIHKGNQQAVDDNMTLDLSAPLYSTITYQDTEISYN
ncbi:hypothetical protein AB733_18595 [Photobacterium swingsii]|uniref:Pullulanase carbohydrate-binding module 41 domain-containing protein n=1 Tax=Photobacterium swingsii TaxID=680026 RepID=A0A0J8V9F3_9GAMM|nr:pullulanase-associated domain-containing protein [Photobacterium swingsii]KMV29250.1 hypothetical protein AB733_18595 [Photobacterium swingsii]PSW23098.1 hypothetical protein C9I94_18160 [Photobacterium swingsii]